MNDKENCRTTRWEDVRVRTQRLYEGTDGVAWLKEFGGPTSPGAVFVMALCEDLDQLQKELTYVHNLVKKLREKLWKPIETPSVGKELSDDIIYDMQKELKEEIADLQKRLTNLEDQCVE